MSKTFKETISRKLILILSIFTITTLTIILTDYIICEFYICSSDEFHMLTPDAAAMMDEKQDFGILVKSIIGIVGLIIIFILSKQMFDIISGQERVREKLKEQNLKIVKKSKELSDVMQQFEDQNFDLEISRKESDASVSFKCLIFESKLSTPDSSPLGCRRSSCPDRPIAKLKSITDSLYSEYPDWSASLAKFKLS